MTSLSKSFCKDAAITLTITFTMVMIITEEETPILNIQFNRRLSIGRLA